VTSSSLLDTPPDDEDPTGGGGGGGALHPEEILLDSPSNHHTAELLLLTQPLLAEKAPPSNNPVMSEVKVKPGHELKLKCDLNNTYGRIMWLLNGNPIRTDNGRYSIQGPNKNRAIEGRLTINNVLPEDNGVWQCHETKFDGKEHVSKPIRVIVLGEFSE